MPSPSTLCPEPWSRCKEYCVCATCCKPRDWRARPSTASSRRNCFRHPCSSASAPLAGDMTTSGSGRMADPRGGVERAEMVASFGKRPPAATRSSMDPDAAYRSNAGRRAMSSGGCPPAARRRRLACRSVQSWSSRFDAPPEHERPRKTHPPRSLSLSGSGTLWVAFDRRKQGWHEKIAGSVVVLARRPKALVKDESAQV